MSTFSGITTVLSSLQAQLRAMDTAGHNIANVNTPGYSRQEAVFASRPGEVLVLGQKSGVKGGGVDIVSVRRAQDAYLGCRLNDATANLSRWTTAGNVLSPVESIISPAADSNLGTVLDQFWDAWQALSLTTDDVAARARVIDRGQAVAATFCELVQQLRRSQSDLDASIHQDISEVNTLTEQIAGLNRDIAAAHAEGLQPNDAMDQRDQLIGRLVELTGASVTAPGGSSPVIALGGKPLVQDTIAFGIAIQQGPDGEEQIVWKEDASHVVVRNGELAGTLQMRTQVIPDYLSQLDSIASEVVTSVNSIHINGYSATGVTGMSFFTPGSTAADLTVDAAILADPDMIATAAGADMPADGSVARQIAQLRNQPMIAGGRSISQAWQALLSQVGSDVKAATDNAATAQQVHEQLFVQQQSLSGVSLDEETAQIVQYQHAYDAAARVLSTINDMLSTLIQHMAP